MCVVLGVPGVSGVLGVPGVLGVCGVPGVLGVFGAVVLCVPGAPFLGVIGVRCSTPIHYAVTFGLKHISTYGYHAVARSMDVLCIAVARYICC